MIKNILIWFLLTLVIASLLLTIASSISNTLVTNSLKDFDIILNLLGFSTILSTIFVCSKIIIKQIKLLKI